MANLYEILADAQNGEALAEIGREYGLTPQQTDAAVAALLPAISMGLKRSTASPEGLGNLLALMGQQPDLQAFYDDPRVAFTPEGRAAGNAALSAMFGSPDASRAIAAQAQNLSGVTSVILKKLLPVIVGMIISGLMRSGSGRAAPQAPQAPQPSPEQGGGLIDILRQIFTQGQQGGPAGTPTGSGSSPWGIPPIGDILGTDRGANSTQSAAGANAEGSTGPIPTDPAEEARPMETCLVTFCANWKRAYGRDASNPLSSVRTRSTFPENRRPAAQARHRTPAVTSSVKSCARSSAARAANRKCPAKHPMWVRRCSAIGSRPAGMSTRVRSTVSRSCSTASLAPNSAEVRSHPLPREGESSNSHHCHKRHTSALWGGPTTPFSGVGVG